MIDREKLPADCEVWTSGDVTLVRGDCLAVLPAIGPVDAVITDPPYGIRHPCGFASRGRSRLAKCNDYPDVVGDDRPFDPSHLLALNVPTVLWGGNHFADRLPASPGWLVWDKRRPDTLDQSTCELAWTNRVKGVRRFVHLWNGCMKASERGESYHPTQKPAALGEWTLGLRWMRGIASVLDPYMGAGFMGVACVRAGRRFVGVEVVREYFEVAKRRILAAQQETNR